MSKRPPDTSAEEPNGGNLHVRLRRGPGQGNRPGLLNSHSPASSTVRSRSVPGSLVVDVDIFDPIRGEESVHAAWKRIQRECPPLFWSPRYGGHWIVTRATDIRIMQVDYERFCNSNSRFPRAERPFPLLPLESDPPEHSGYRMLIAPAFAPKAVASVESTARRVAIETIEALVPKGACDFVADFSRVLPIVVFLGMMQLPLEDRFELLPYADAVARAKDQAVANAARVKVGEYLTRWVTERRQRPGDDIISRVATATVNGRKLSEPEVFGLCSLVLLGGLDTVAALLGFAAAFLAGSPPHRQRLIREPAIIPAAVEELFRRFGIVNQSRCITRDMDYEGVSLRAGDVVILPNMLVGLDDANAPDPMRVDFDREGAEHAIFGGGPHRCVGAILARREMVVFLEEWLKRIPEFEIAPDMPLQVVCGTVTCMPELHLRW